MTQMNMGQFLLAIWFAAQADIVLAGGFLQELLTLVVALLALLGLASAPRFLRVVAEEASWWWMRHVRWPATWRRTCRTYPPFTPYSTAGAVSYWSESWRAEVRLLEYPRLRARSVHPDRLIATWRCM